MHGAAIQITLCTLFLLALTGCKTGGGDVAFQVDSQPPQEKQGIMASLSKQIQGSRNKNARPTTAKPASARSRKPFGSGDAADQEDTKQTGTTAKSSSNSEIDGLLGAFESESPQVQEAARRLAAANSLPSPLKKAAKTEQPAENEAEDHQPIAQAVATSPSKDTDGSHDAVRQAAASTSKESPNHVAFASPTVDLATEEADDNPEKTKTVALAAPTPEEVLAELSTQQQLEALIKKMSQQESQSTDTPEGLKHATSIRILQLLAGKLDDAMSPVPELSTTEQEYVRHQLMALWNVTDPGGPPTRSRRWTTALGNLRLASSNLAAATETLDVSGLAFCTEVESYGRVSPFDDYDFEPGQQVILYCEIDHFAAERLSDGYETHFQGSYEIFNADGVRVADQVLPADKQTCNNFRRDYFIAYRLYLPKQLKPGPHRIQLTVEDLKGNKYGQTVLDFKVSEAKKAKPKS